jgi:hypothetical protein
VIDSIVVPLDPPGLAEVVTPVRTHTDYRTTVMMGNVCEATNGKADDSGAMQIMATHGDGGLQQMRTGSTGTWLVQRNCPPPTFGPAHSRVAVADAETRAAMGLPTMEKARIST